MKVSLSANKTPDQSDRDLQESILIPYDGIQLLQLP